ncbi:aldo/keto reductase [Kordiimonas lacus]|uniref:Aldo/keto reductase n=1 Tax=Kordiimonas lacus TaxID=637679 RepID=A0A1G7CFG9_9PROT|nr:aldo/keto reductase [Kordiimonas lacus]SDE38122.1 Aldo/keto reductase [Kordiimonas lacus]
MVSGKQMDRPMDRPMDRRMDRRTVLAMLGAAGVSLAGLGAASAASDMLLKRIPSSGEAIPTIGLGSWITFNVGNDPVGLEASQKVIAAFLEAGGRMIDSSPMYGSSQATIGQALTALGAPPSLMATDKVWINGARQGRAQVQASLKNWGVLRFSLLQVHNLRDWQAHLPVLFEMKAAGAIDYVGVTTSHGRRHRELAAILENQPLDFVQLTYNMTNREAEDRILPLARERGIGVIVNRPFDGGRLIRAVKRHPFPAWAKAEGFKGWADYLLKFNVSHPAVVCAIPATTQVAHVRENMAASKGRLPDATLRARMAAYVKDL